MKSKQKQKVKGKSKQKTGSIGEIQNARVEYLRKQLAAYKTSADKSYVGISRGLREVYKKDYWKDYGYDSLETYAQTELDMNLQVVRRYIRIADKMDELGITEKQAVAIGWSKMSVLVRIATTKNIKKWLERAQKSSLRDISKAASLVTSSEDSVAGTVPKIVTMTFKMSEDQNSAIVDAINAAKEMTNSEDPIEALHHLSLDWLELKGKTPKMVSLDDRINYLEKQYGVKLVVKGDKKAPVKEVAKKEVKVKKKKTMTKPPEKKTKKVVKKNTSKKKSGKGKKDEDGIDSMLNDDTKPVKKDSKKNGDVLPEEVDSDINDMLGL